MRPPTVFADECTFGVTVRLLRSLGFQVIRAQDRGMMGAPDPDIYREAQKPDAVLVTNDKGFGNVRKYPPSAHSGIIVLKMLPDPQAVEEVHKVLGVLLRHETKFRGALFVVDRNKYRKRTAP